ncbi:MAG: GNAT family N-acetyltransferase [Roseibium sp.]|uniref:GNAT family N-acetyltransferase n=1 Tax=Roseibium sp. TaxID=1936156 RepID=UPI00262FD099|nr:GNAT family N-acetyltransferase [Roseibium sp.]MCV0426469.1 GNAT family N-acetyltransferase [Roseibium sp.]
MPFTVLPANSMDADEIALLLRRSILELCIGDHGNDPENFEPWLKNKTPDNVERWISGNNRMFSAIDQSRRVIGVGMGTTNGEVVLNYVLPDARCIGVSKALMRALEDYFRERGLEVSILKSTSTAERFYRSIGYSETGKTEIRRDMVFRQFKKAL